MQDAWREYLELALGVTQASRRKATEVVRSLAEQGGAKVSDLQGMAEELVSTSIANREGLIKLIRFELDRALGKVGLATSDEVADLTARVQQLETALRQARQQAASAEQAAAEAEARAASVTEPTEVVPVKAPVRKTAAKKVVKKTTAKKAAKKVPAKKKAAKKAIKGTSTKKGNR